jgi:hypothetical protein
MLDTPFLGGFLNAIEATCSDLFIGIYSSFRSGKAYLARF